MKINLKLVALIIFIAFLGSIVPLTLNLLKVYDQSNEVIKDNALQAIIWCGMATALSSISITILLVASSKTARIQSQKSKDDLDITNDQYQNNEVEDLKTNLITESEIKRSLQNKNNIQVAGESLLKTLSKKIEIVQGVIYTKQEDQYEFTAGYALNLTNGTPPPFSEGDGILGQCAKSKKQLMLNNIPEDTNLVESGLGESQPKNILLIPVILKKKNIAVIELGSFSKFSDDDQASFELLNDCIATEIQSYLKPKTDPE